MAHLALVAAGLLVDGAAAPSSADDARPDGVRGVVRAEAAATISSELVARVASIPFKAGQPFQAGDVLLMLDCRRYEADLRAAEAEAKTHEITLDTHRSLLRHRATGANEVALAEAKFAQALATADSLRLRISQCRIVAPYSGRVVERIVDVFEMPQANAPLMRIVKDGRLELDLIVPSHWAVWLKSGFEFAFTVDETGTTHQARLLELGAIVDPVSRTMKVAAEIVAPSPLVRPGMSGSAMIRAPSPEGR